MRLLFLRDAWDDYLYWQKMDKAKLKRVNELIGACLREPFTGIGKPEPLKFDMAGCWSRRIDSEHRLIYKLENQDLVIIQCRYHY
jgi:toxin YoeB